MKIQQWRNVVVIITSLLLMGGCAPLMENTTSLLRNENPFSTRSSSLRSNWKNPCQDLEPKHFINWRLI